MYQLSYNSTRVTIIVQAREYQTQQNQLHTDLQEKYAQIAIGYIIFLRFDRKRAGSY